MSITIKNAQVTETKVTVQNVIIGKRQLTQRVFKQILSERFFNGYTGELKGEVWGYVNYFWKENQEYSDKCKHVIWVTSQGELRRDFINKNRFNLNPFGIVLNDNEIYQMRITKGGDNLLLDFQINKELQKFLNVLSIDCSFQPFPLLNGMNILQESLSERKKKFNNLWDMNYWSLYIEGSKEEIPFLRNYRDKEYLDNIGKFYPESISILKANIKNSLEIVNIGHTEYKKIILPKIQYNLIHLYNTLPQLYIAV